ncbi:hypothetical protein [Streptomyces sp. NPDC048436]|uniref:hypothetical protein n=1 Tax=Streptomyces sp. NPDC048436 TaxID=3365550 RepID=UPI00371F45CA
MTRARQQAARSTLPACSSAILRTRSGTYTPSGALAVHPKARNAVHAFDGNLLPDGARPEASCANAGRSQ